MRAAGVSTAVVAVMISIAIMFAGCNKHDCCAPRKPGMAQQVAGKSPRDTITALITAKEKAAKEKENKKPEQLLSTRAAAAINKAGSLEKEQIAEVKTTGATATVLTKKRLYEIDPKTGIVAPADTYEERLYTLKLEQGLWKIDNSAFRMRGADESGGFTPRWRPGMDDWR